VRPATTGTHFAWALRGSTRTIAFAATVIAGIGEVRPPQLVFVHLDDDLTPMNLIADRRDEFTWGRRRDMTPRNHGESLMLPEGKYWFPAKRYGWGWGLPSTWQGWLVLAALLGLVVVDTIVFPPTTSPLSWFVCITVLNALFFGVCWLKGQPPRWRWGNDERA
jgi:hypothetical protein